MGNEKTAFRAVSLVAFFLCLVVLSPVAASAGPKIYLHFTIKAFVDLPDTNGVEWAWVTMVELDKPKAYPAEAEVAQEHGGKLEGTVFAFVQGAAWRSAHRYKRDVTCKGLPSKSETFWEESESDSVYAMGQLIDTNPVYSFRFGFTNRRILLPDGTWIDPGSETNVFVGAINVEGEVHEETRGDFYLQVVNYRDNLEHRRRCGKAWVEQYLTAFRSFHIVMERPAVGEYLFAQTLDGPTSRKHFVYRVDRSTSPEHPFWKQQTM